ncbi:hypothetical protein AB1Y20_016784 [Prymnesium parvum]|uniref:Protein of centriole 5 n=1 Tax=Prymnesium parvum TaxID=97485 RepID=A0AB34I9C2_PRYPA
MPTPPSPSIRRGTPSSPATPSDGRRPSQSPSPPRSAHRDSAGAFLHSPPSQPPESVAESVQRANPSDPEGQFSPDFSSLRSAPNAAASPQLSHSSMDGVVVYSRRASEHMRKVPEVHQSNSSHSSHAHALHLESKATTTLARLTQRKSSTHVASADHPKVAVYPDIHHPLAPEAHHDHLMAAVDPVLASRAEEQHKELRPHDESFLASLTFGGLQRWLVRLQSASDRHTERLDGLQAAHEALEQKFRALHREALTERMDSLQKSLEENIERVDKQRAAVSDRVELLSDRLEAALQNLDAFNQDASVKLNEIEKRIEVKLTDVLRSSLENRWTLTQEEITASRTTQDERIAAVEAKMELLTQRESLERMVTMQETFSQRRVDQLEARCVEMAHSTRKLARQVREVGFAFGSRKRRSMLGVVLKSGPVVTSAAFECWLIFTKAAAEVRQTGVFGQHVQDVKEDAITKAIRDDVTASCVDFEKLRLGLRISAHSRFAAAFGAGKSSRNLKSSHAVHAAIAKSLKIIPMNREQAASSIDEQTPLDVCAAAQTEAFGEELGEDSFLVPAASPSSDLMGESSAEASGLRAAEEGDGGLLGQLTDWVHGMETEMDGLRAQVEAMRAEMLGLAGYQGDPHPAARNLVEGVMQQTAHNTAEIKRLEGSMQHMHHGSRAAELAVARALKLLHEQACWLTLGVISKPGREELERSLNRAMNSSLDSESRLRIVNSTLDALAAEVRSRASLDRVAELEAALNARNSKTSALQGRKELSASKYPSQPYCVACHQLLPLEDPPLSPQDMGPMPLESKLDIPVRRSATINQPPSPHRHKPIAGAFRPRPASADLGYNNSFAHARSRSSACFRKDFSVMHPAQEYYGVEVLQQSPCRRKCSERRGSSCASRHYGVPPENAQRREMAAYMQRLAQQEEMNN